MVQCLGWGMVQFGVRHGPVDKAPDCCKVALGSIPRPSNPKNGVISVDEKPTGGMKSPREKKQWNQPCESLKKNCRLHWCRAGLFENNLDCAWKSRIWTVWTKIVPNLRWRIFRYWAVRATDVWNMGSNPLWGMAQFLYWLWPKNKQASSQLQDTSTTQNSKQNNVGHCTRTYTIV